METLNPKVRSLANNSRRRFIRGFFTLSVSLLCTGTTFIQRNEPSREYQIKAVFLFNFAQFVEWPSHTFPEAQSPFIIGVLGEDPFGTYLDETVLGEKTNGHPLVIQRFQRIGDIKSCHILFINMDDKEKLEQALANLRSKNILTVGDASSFAKQGGMIRFFTESNKIRIQVNLEAAKAADLTISSKLLRLAEIFSSKTN